MPIIHNESFHDSDPFQLRRFGYDMEGGPEVVVEQGGPRIEPINPAIFDEPGAEWPETTPPGKPEPSLARFVAYWTPERRAQRVAEELHE